MKLELEAPAEPLLHRLRETGADLKVFQLLGAGAVLRAADSPAEEKEEHEEKKEGSEQPSSAEEEGDVESVIGAKLLPNSLFVRSLLSSGPSLSAPLPSASRALPFSAQEMVSPWTGLLKTAAPGIYSHEGFPAGEQLAWISSRCVLTSSAGKAPVQSGEVVLPEHLAASLHAQFLAQLRRLRRRLAKSEGGQSEAEGEAENGDVEGEDQKSGDEGEESLVVDVVFQVTDLRKGLREALDHQIRAKRKQHEKARAALLKQLMNPKPNNQNQNGQNKRNRGGNNNPNNQNLQNIIQNAPEDKDGIRGFPINVVHHNWCFPDPLMVLSPEDLVFMSPGPLESGEDDKGKQNKKPQQQKKKNMNKVGAIANCWMCAAPASLPDAATLEKLQQRSIEAEQQQQEQQQQGKKSKRSSLGEQFWEEAARLSSVSAAAGKGRLNWVRMEDKLTPVSLHTDGRAGGMGLCLSPNNARINLQLPVLASPVPNAGSASAGPRSSERLHSFWTLALMPPLFKHSRFGELRAQGLRKRRAQRPSVNGPENEGSAASAAEAEDEEASFFFDDKLDNHTEEGEDASGNSGGGNDKEGKNGEGVPSTVLLNPAKLINVRDDGFRALAVLHLVLSDGLTERPEDLLEEQRVRGKPSAEDVAEELAKLKLEQQQAEGDNNNNDNNNPRNQNKQNKGQNNQNNKKNNNNQNSRPRRINVPSGPVYRALALAAQESWTAQELLLQLKEALLLQGLGAEVLRPAEQLFGTEPALEGVPELPAQ